MAINWTYQNKEITSLKDLPKWAEHFVYMITDDNGKIYIGKKQILSTRNVEVSKKVYDTLKKAGESIKRTKNKTKSKKGKIVWRYKKTVVSENNWLNYTGSCIPLNKAIKEGLGYKKEILYFCKTKKQATYYELKEQFCLGVLENKSFWNENIMSKFFTSDLLDNN